MAILFRFAPKSNIISSETKEQYFGKSSDLTRSSYGKSIKNASANRSPYSDHLAFHIAMKSNKTCDVMCSSPRGEVEHIS